MGPKINEVSQTVSTVSAESIEELNPIKLEQALQGTVSGVNISSQSGSPGAGINIRIREFLPMEMQAQQ